MTRPLPPDADGPLILVVGAGAAGMACAIAASRAGARVILVERQARSGGTVADALIHTIGGLFDDQGRLANDGIPAELAERLEAADPRAAPRRIGRTHVLDVDPEAYRDVTARWLAEEPRIRLFCESEVQGVTVAAGRVRGTELRLPGEVVALEPCVAVDASGDGALVRRIDPRQVAPGAALAGLIVRLRGVEPDALAFPKGVALIKALRAAARDGELPPACASVWPDRGVMADEVYLKFNLDAADHAPAAFAATLDRLLSWLRAEPRFARAELAGCGRLGIRDGGRVRGEYCLLESDVRAGRRFADAVCRGAWPIEHWDRSEGLRLDYLAPGTLYDIPLKALRVAGYGNLYAVGKHLSAEPRAQASARVAGTCWAMGAGLGSVIGAAAMSKEMADAV